MDTPAPSCPHFCSLRPAGLQLGLSSLPLSSGATTCLEESLRLLILPSIPGLSPGVHPIPAVPFYPKGSAWWAGESVGFLTRVLPGSMPWLSVWGALLGGLWLLLVGCWGLLSEESEASRAPLPSRKWRLLSSSWGSHPNLPTRPTDIGPERAGSMPEVTQQVQPTRQTLIPGWV